jgi:DHA1 family bicyclomycin/chloramphenicol resistance-like MFS transporter
MAFSLLLSFLVALPSFGIAALTAMGAALHVGPAQAGLMMSLFLCWVSPSRREA